MKKEYKNRVEHTNDLGQWHRENGPAIEWENGHKEWHINDKLHREDGPAVEYANGDKVWYMNNKRHREDGPAIECVRGKFWYLDGKNYGKKKPRNWGRLVMEYKAGKLLEM